MHVLPSRPHCYEIHAKAWHSSIFFDQVSKIYLYNVMFNDYHAIIIDKIKYIL